ncbi:TPA: hypothetical protein N3Z77_004705 [Salmonella enterica subsp. enterica serovar 14:z:e,n,x]|nr:hypothetical protein [Salmonella enterica subsp. enterica serovar 14:z:e,n,x]
MLARTQEFKPFIERDSRELNLAERLIKYCEEGVKIYESGDVLACYRKGLLKRTDPPHYFPRSYFVRRLNRFIPISVGDTATRSKLIDDMLTKLVNAGFLKVAAVVQGGLQYELTGLHTTSAAKRLKEL